MDSMKNVLKSLDAIIANTESVLNAASGTPETKKGSEAIPGSSSDKKKEKKEKKEKEKKEKKEKKKKAPKPAAEPGLPAETTQFMQCDLRVGKVISVAHHPEADGLYVLSVAYGGDETRSVCAGLREYVAEDDLRNSLVVTICNLKPRMLRGVRSEAMILAGSVKTDSGGKESVVPLKPPMGANAGDLVSVRDMTGERSVVEGKFVSGKAWDKVVARLSVAGEKACYDGKPLIVGDEQVQCALPDGAEIH